jgi:hypothetical protein
MLFDASSCLSSCAWQPSPSGIGLWLTRRFEGSTSALSSPRSQTAQLFLVSVVSKDRILILLSAYTSRYPKFVARTLLELISRLPSQSWAFVEWQLSLLYWLLASAFDLPVE